MAMKRIFSFFLTVALVISAIAALNSCQKVDINSVDCKELDLKTISAEYWNNSYRAKETYVDNYVYTTGTVYLIHGEKSLRIRQYNPNLTSSNDEYGYAYCTIKSNEYSELILGLDVGDVVKIKGKVTDLEPGTSGVTVDIDTYYIEVIQ